MYSILQELQQLQRANQQLREEMRRLEETMAYNMVDCRDMEAALRRVEDEVSGTHQSPPNGYILCYHPLHTGTLKTEQKATGGELSPTATGDCPSPLHSLLQHSPPSVLVSGSQYPSASHRGRAEQKDRGAAKTSSSGP